MPLDVVRIPDLQHRSKSDLEEAAAKLVFHVTNQLQTGPTQTLLAQNHCELLNRNQSLQLLVPVEDDVKLVHGA